MRHDQRVHRQLQGRDEGDQEAIATKRRKKLYSSHVYPGPPRDLREELRQVFSFSGRLEGLYSGPGQDDRTEERTACCGARQSSRGKK